MTDDEFRRELLKVLTSFSESAESLAKTGVKARENLDLLTKWVAAGVHTQKAANERLGRIEAHLAGLVKEWKVGAKKQEVLEVSDGSSEGSGEEIEIVDESKEVGKEAGEEESSGEESEEEGDVTEGERKVEEGRKQAEGGEDTEE